MHIVIIGGGLSACLLSLHLLKSGVNRPLTITVIEKRPSARLGDAFCTETDCHLLNVPVARMSAWQNEPDHLLKWLIEEGVPYESGSFIPRKLYKKYIKSLLAGEIFKSNYNVRLCFLQAEAYDIDYKEKLIITTKGRLKADKLILAIGNFSPAALRLPNNDYLKSDRYYSSAWQPELFNKLERQQPVLIIGTGLTMVDVVLTLQERCHTGPITALSTHGFIPVSHEKTIPYPGFLHELEGLTDVVDLFKVIRRHMQIAATMNVNWRAVIDSLRPFTQKIWLSLPLPQKRRFMEHLRHLWGVARHRMAPENAQIIEQLICSGRLKIISGRIRSIIEMQGAGFEVLYKERDTRAARRLLVNAIVNCMGPASDLNKVKEPLLMNLLQKGIIQTDEMQQGIDCLPNGAVIDRRGMASDFIYTIGSPMKGILWESTAVPEIRLQAQQLATMLMSEKVINTEIIKDY